MPTIGRFSKRWSYNFYPFNLPRLSQIIALDHGCSLKTTILLTSHHKNVAYSRPYNPLDQGIIAIWANWDFSFGVSGGFSYSHTTRIGWKMYLAGVDTSLMLLNFLMVSCLHTIMIRISWRRFVSVRVYCPIHFIPQLGRFPSHHRIFPFLVDFLARVYFMMKWYKIRSCWMEPTNRDNPICLTVVTISSWHTITSKIGWKDKGKWASMTWKEAILAGRSIPFVKLSPQTLSHHCS